MCIRDRGNRRLARKLVEAWSRPVVGKHVDMKNLEAATEMRFKRDVRGKVAAVDQKKDDADAMIDRKIKLVADNAENITTVVAQKTRNHEAIVMMMQHKMAQIQEKKAEFDRQQDRGA